MRFFQSIQSKQIVAMLAVTTLALVASSWTSYTWLQATSNAFLEEQAFRALVSFEAGAIQKHPGADLLVGFVQRFNIAGAALAKLRDTQEPPAIVGISQDDLTRVGGWNALRTRGIRPEVWLDDSEQSCWGVRQVVLESRARYLLVVRAAAGEESAQLHSFSILIWTTLGGSIALTILASYLLRNVFIKPIRNLSLAANRIADGDLSCNVDTDVDCEILPLVESFNTMTERLRTTRKLVQEYQGMLEQRLGEIGTTLQRKEEELIQAQKLAGIGQLAAGIAHELNNPLYYIILSADLVKEDVQDPAIQQKIDKILEQTRRCQRIVSDLLEYSRKGARPEGSFDINAALERMIDEFRQVGHLDGVETQIEIQDDLPRFRGSEDEIRRLLDIVLINSTHALNGNGAISLNVYRSDNAMIEIELKDNGPGMDEDTRTRAFEPFFTTKDVGEGTGLGLSIAYGIVTRYRGRISIESEPGVGTCVRILLPFESGQQTDESDKNSADAMEPQS